MSENPKFKATISNLHSKFKGKHGVDRTNVKIFHYGKGKQTFTQQEINQFATKMSKKLGDKFSLEVNAKYGSRWFTGQLTKAGGDVYSWDPQEEYDPLSNEVIIFEKFKDNIKRFNIVALYNGKPIGGNDKRNHCLYNALSKALGGNENLPWKYPINMKKFLGLQSDDKIGLEHIPTLEEKLNVKINVAGDYNYQSTKANTTREINLNLLKEHYSLAKQEKLAKGVSYKERKIVFHEENLPDGGKFYDGKKHYMLTWDEIREIRMKPLTADSVIVYGYSGMHDIEAEYKKYIEDVEEIKKASKGRINFYKTGTIKNTALHLFEDVNIGSNKPDPVSYLESKFINGCYNFGLLQCEPYKGTVHCYDERSFYSSILKSQIQLPYKAGNFKKITQKDFDEFKFLPYGIYHCKIEGSHKLLNKSKENKYTSTTLSHAIEKLKLKVKMIIDDGPNLLEYPPETRIQSSVLFKQYVEYLYPLKQKGVKLAKILLNIIWGALSEQKHREYVLDLEDEEQVITLDDEEMETGFRMMSDRYMKVETVNVNQVFLTGYARIKPFLTSKGRVCIANAIEPYADKIVRIHTDGVIANEKLDLNIGTEIGEFAYEGCYEAIIKSVNSVRIKCKECGDYIRKNAEKEHLKNDCDDN